MTVGGDEVPKVCSCKRPVYRDILRALNYLWPLAWYVL